MDSIVECRIKEILGKLLKETTPSEDILIESALTDISVDSVTFIQLAVALEAEYKIEFGIDDLNFRKYSTVRDVCRYVESRLLESTGQVGA